MLVLPARAFLFTLCLLFVYCVYRHCAGDKGDNSGTHCFDVLQESLSKVAEREVRCLE